MICKEGLLFSVDPSLDIHKHMVYILLGADVANKVGYEQNNPHYCYDIMEHSLCTASCVLSRIDYVNTSEDILKVAEFYYDIGKPYVVSEKEGRFVFYHHTKNLRNL